MRKANAKILIGLLVALGAPLVFTSAALAAPASPEVTQVENFIKTVVQAMAGIAGLIAAAFFVIGGYTYIVSTGNPERLDKAKRTILYSAMGLVIVIAAFVITNFVSGTAKGAFGG